MVRGCFILGGWLKLWTEPRITKNLAGTLAHSVDFFGDRTPPDKKLEMHVHYTFVYIIHI